MSEAALPRAHGEVVLSATVRTSPEDFFVEENDAFAASGAVGHLLLANEQHGMNPAYAPKLLAPTAGVGEHAIGYAGHKDRLSLTQQRFRVPLPVPPAPHVTTPRATG